MTSTVDSLLFGVLKFFMMFFNPIGRHQSDIDVISDGRPVEVFLGVRSTIESMAKSVRALQRRIGVGVGTPEMDKLN